MVQTFQLFVYNGQEDMNNSNIIIVVDANSKTFPLQH